MASRPTLHVTNGQSTAQALRAAALEGDVLAWDDVLPEGPLASVPASELRALRAGFLSACGWGDARAIAADLERRDRTLAEALDAGRPVVLWFEQDVLDQLQLLHVLVTIAEHDRADGVGLIVVGEVAGHPDFRGLGELAPAELAALWPARVTLTPAVSELARRAWDAACAPAPTALAALLASDTSALPLLAPALRRWLDELPDTTAGLAASERRLLDALAAGPRDARALFLDCMDGERLLLNGDTWLWRRLAALGHGPNALIAGADGSAVPAPPPLGDERTFTERPFALTDAGRRVRAAQLDRVELLGLDRWLGGTHLHGARVWRRDGGRLVAP